MVDPKQRPCKYQEKCPVIKFGNECIRYLRPLTKCSVERFYDRYPVYLEDPLYQRNMKDISKHFELDESDELGNGFKV